MFNNFLQKNKKTARILAFLVVFNFIFSDILIVNAFYNDTENALENNFTSGNVDFTLTNSEFSPITSYLNLGVGDSATKEIIVNEQTSNPFKYIVQSKNFSEDIDFCEGLNAKFSIESNEMYNGLLSNLLTGETEVLNTGELILTTATTFANKICMFNTEYRGSQTRHNYPLMSAYNDTEIVSHKIFSAGFRINKIYYDVDVKHGVEGTNEWIEIYNQTDTALDISGWEICDGISCDTIPLNTPLVPGKGFAVITRDNTTWPFWDMPNDIVKIVLDSNIGNGLDNSNEMLLLKRPDGVIIDQMNYGNTPDLTWNNYDSDIWNPGSVDVPEGHMLGRKPNGYDTNMPSDFVDLALPVVLLINPTQVGNQTWYWNYVYNIIWNATNPNGPDSDIKINLYYIKDIDGSQTITPADTTLTIATNLSNSGSYSWTLPSGFLGYIWVKIVATGPENPMLNARMISGKVYDPIPGDISLFSPETLFENILEVILPEKQSIKVEETQAEIEFKEGELILDPTLDPIIVNQEGIIENSVIENVEIIEEKSTSSSDAHNVPVENIEIAKTTEIAEVQEINSSNFVKETKGTSRNNILEISEETIIETNIPETKTEEFKENVISGIEELIIKETTENTEIVQPIEITETIEVVEIVEIQEVIIPETPEVIINETVEVVETTE